MTSFLPQRLRVHWQAFRLLVRQQILAQIVGQLLRMAGAALVTVVGLVPHGIHF